MDNHSLWEWSKKEMLWIDHVNYLPFLRDTYDFHPNVIYDIGSCVLDWAKPAKRTWPNSDFYLFEAMEEVGEIYKAFDYNNYHLGVLSDEDGKEVKFYKNLEFPGGNSYYKENSNYCNLADIYFTENHASYLVTSKLDTVVESKNYPFPELLKLDVQGCEIDILKGATECLKTVKHLIIELQHVEYNIGACTVNTSIPFIESLGFRLEKFFCPMAHDGDYHFIKI